MSIHAYIPSTLELYVGQEGYEAQKEESGDETKNLADGE